jgi:hypothetical protein
MLVEILGGSFGQRKAALATTGTYGNKPTLRISLGFFKTHEVRLRTDVASVELSSSESALNAIGGLVGAVAGDVIADDAGLIAGAIIGSRGTEAFFKVTLNDGRTFVAKASMDDYQAIVGAVEDGKSQAATATPQRSAILQPAARTGGAKRLALTVGLWLALVVMAGLGLGAAGLGDVYQSSLFPPATVAAAVLCWFMAGRFLEKGPVPAQV